MKKSITICALLMGASMVSAQTMKIHLSDGTTATYPADQVNYVEFIEDNTPGGNGYDNGHEYVDLGLPSGLLWATCNVGANSPEDYGDYFAWGETEPKSCYDKSTYKWFNAGDGTLTKYCTSSYEGSVDNKTILEPEDDAAYVKWGGSWRIPTYEEQIELRDETAWEWTMQNGANGYKVTGPNGNSIFLPAAGFRYDSVFDYAGSDGIYWSSSLAYDYSFGAYFLVFNSSGVGWYDIGRVFGRSVRPVR